ncbi:MAG: DinB family protein [Terriglobia bacterium]
MTTDNFQKMFDYDLWANQRALESIPSAPSQDEAQRLMGHIVGAQQIWLGRFGAFDELSRQLSEVSGLLQIPVSGAPEPWPKLTIEQCRAALPELHAAWKDLLRQVSSGELTGDVSYRDSKGSEFKNPVADVLTHVVMHSIYHRGQVAAAVRQAGGKPASTDYIVYVRQLAPPD